MTILGGPRWRQPIAPHCRGRVRPRLIRHWRTAGWCVHQVGQAAYVHDRGRTVHLLTAVWDRGARPPPWSSRLGRPSDGYIRRVDRAIREQRWRRLARSHDGRFLGLMLWWGWPSPAVYRWDR